MTTAADRWRDAAFLVDATTWLDERLAELGRERTGEVEQPHVTSWSTVLRVPTHEGTTWFKATTAQQAHEAGVHAVLAERSPQRVPPLLAADPDRSWLLMDDAGERLREVVAREGSLERWHDALAAVAQVQAAATQDVDRLLAAGAPAFPLATLADRYLELVDRVGAEQRFRDAAPLVADLADRLADSGVPDTIEHDDLHDGQVFAQGGSHRVMDWGDSCVAHPFLVLSVPLTGIIAWGLDDVEDSVPTAPFRDSYLAAFAAATGRDPGRLVDAAQAATRLGWALRAVNGHVEGEEGATRNRLLMLVDGRVG